MPFRRFLVRILREDVVQLSKGEFPRILAVLARLLLTFLVAGPLLEFCVLLGKGEILRMLHAELLEHFLAAQFGEQTLIIRLVNIFLMLGLLREDGVLLGKGEFLRITAEFAE